MIRSAKKSPFTSDRPVYLYDRVKQDIFEEECHNNNKATIIPSITTLFLLQLQASIIKIVTMLPPKRTQDTETLFEAYAPSCLIRQSMRWLLLAGLLFLDNVARLLNVQDEMNRISRRGGNKKKNHHELDDDDLFFGYSSTAASSVASSVSSQKTLLMKQRYNNGSSGATTPTIFARCSRPCCATSDPQTIYPSPPPSSPLLSSSSFQSPVRRVREKCISFPTTKQQPPISYEKSPAISKSTQQTGRHTLSITTNSIQYPSKRKSSSPNSSLRQASPTQRHTVQKETTAWANKKQAHHSTTSSLAASSSGSSCESVQHDMKNTRASTEVYI
ncbi:hypothetical protein K501DRAFT_276600 [Backusella circina FSU 941]|nr:hypothetical protein K501DRAFT_276600 [Backusella circina FSU 941]